MTDRELVEFAEGMGFSAAAVVDTAEVPFRAAFRVCCEENLCGKYGVNYSCPPDCGTQQQMEAKIHSRKKALVLQTMWETTEAMIGPETTKAVTEHNAMIRSLIDEATRRGCSGFMVGASGCSLCRDCAIVENKPCRYPELMYSCMSAYSIYVLELAEKCAMDYDLGTGLIALFGMFVYDNE